MDYFSLQLKYEHSRQSSNRFNNWIVFFVQAEDLVNSFDFTLVFSKKGELLGINKRGGLNASKPQLKSLRPNNTFQTQETKKSVPENKKPVRPGLHCHHQD